MNSFMAHPKIVVLSAGLFILLAWSSAGWGGAPCTIAPYVSSCSDTNYYYLNSTETFTTSEHGPPSYNQSRFDLIPVTGIYYACSYGWRPYSDVNNHGEQESVTCHSIPGWPACAPQWCEYKAETDYYDLNGYFDTELPKKNYYR